MKVNYYHIESENIDLETTPGERSHFSPYTSKWNPVENMVFPHITRSLKGVILKSYEFVKELIENTTTKTGLK